MTAPTSRVDGLVLARMQAAAGQVPDRVGLDERSRRALDLAEALGAPVGASLAAAQAANDDRDALRRTVHVASAQARFVARGLVALPLLLLPGLDLAADMGLVGFYTTAPGRGVALVAGILLAAGALASRQQVASVRRRARPGARKGADDEVANLLAAALRAGLPLSAALRAVGDRRPDQAADLRRAALALEQGRPLPDERPTRRRRRTASPTSAAVELAVAADRLGAPAGVALEDLARRQRAEHHATVAARAEQLPSRLALPSVLLLLPATVLLVGAPIVAAGLTGG